MSAFASVKTPIGTAGLKDLSLVDLPAVVEYWILSSDEYLSFMGVDRERLGSADEIHKRFSNAIRAGDTTQPSIAFGITLDERLVGYTMLNHCSDETNYSHWHIMDRALRAKGLSTALYPFRIKAYFDVLPISRLVHQTRTRNRGVNRMLDKFVAVSETKFIEKPDGVASSGEFHLRSDVPTLFARATELGFIPNEARQPLG